MKRIFSLPSQPTQSCRHAPSPPPLAPRIRPSSPHHQDPGRDNHNPLKPRSRFIVLNIASRIHVDIRSAAGIGGSLLQMDFVPPHRRTPDRPFPNSASLSAPFPGARLACKRTAWQLHRLRKSASALMMDHLDRRKKQVCLRGLKGKPPTITNPLPQ